MDTPEPSAPSTFGQRMGSALGSFFRGLLRLLFILLIVAAIGAAIYFGIPALYRQFVMPVQNQGEQILDLQAQLAQSQKQADARQTELQNRLTTLEKQRALDVQSLSELRTGQQMLEKSILDQNQTLKRLDTLNAHLNELEGQLVLNRKDIKTIENQLSSADSPLASLKQDVQVLQAMELLSRSRLFLMQNNYGLARQDAEAARVILARLQASLPATAPVSTWISRLDLAINNLPGSPVLAADDLEITWRLLSAGLTPEPAAANSVPATPTPTATPWLTPTPTGTLPTPLTSATPTPAVTSTPTPAGTRQASPTASPTPWLTATRTPTPAESSPTPSATPRP